MYHVIYRVLKTDVPPMMDVPFNDWTDTSLVIYKSARIFSILINHSLFFGALLTRRVNTMTSCVDSRDTMKREPVNQTKEDIKITSQPHVTNEEMTSNGHVDWINVEVENHAHQISALDGGPASTSARGMLPDDSRVYLLSAGENGELVCRGSFDGGSYRDDNECSSLRSDHSTNSSQGMTIYYSSKGI